MIGGEMSKQYKLKSVNFYVYIPQYPIFKVENIVTNEVPVLRVVKRETKIRNGCLMKRRLDVEVRSVFALSISRTIRRQGRRLRKSADCCQDHQLLRLLRREPSNQLLLSFPPRPLLSLIRRFLTVIALKRSF